MTRVAVIEDTRARAEGDGARRTGACRADPPRHRYEPS
jgi:hypothetical protein